MHMNANYIIKINSAMCLMPKYIHPLPSQPRNRTHAPLLDRHRWLGNALIYLSGLDPGIILLYINIYPRSSRICSTMVVRDNKSN